MADILDEDRVSLSRENNRTVRQRSLRLLRSLIHPIRRTFAYGIVLVVFAQATRVLGPLLVAAAIDTALPALQGGQPLPLIIVAGAYVAAAIATGFLTAGYIRVSARISQSILFDLRRRVFRHTQRLSLEFHERYTSGRIISRQTSDLEAVRELLDNGVNSIVSGLLSMLFVAIITVSLDPISGGILFVAVIPMVVLTRWFQRSSQLAYRATRTASARLIGHFVETITGMSAVQVFRQEGARSRVNRRLSDDYRDATLMTMRLNGVFDPGLVLIGNLTVVAVLVVGGLRALDGGLAVGVLVAAVLYARRFFSPVQQMAMFYNSFQSATAALEKVSGLLEHDPDVRPPDDPIAVQNLAGEVAFRGVTFGYSKEAAPTLPRIDLVIPAGQTVAVVGETGAGKSTLAKLVARFYDPLEGSVELDGVDLRSIASQELRSAIVMVTQEAFLFSGSVAENIALGRPDATIDEITRAAKLVGAHEFIEALPEGYDSDVTKRGARLSAGQRQLVAFARAFLADPAVLILDEATSALDLPSERLVQKGLEGLLKDRTALIIAHRLSTVQIADRVLVVGGGQILEDGSPEELVAAGGAFAALNRRWIEANSFEG